MSVIRCTIILSLFVQGAVLAQPSFCFVLAAESNEALPLRHSVTVVQHYRERIPYVGFNGSYLGPLQELTLQSGPLFRDSTQRWLVYSPVQAVAESFVLVVDRGDTMCIDLPEDPKALIDRAWRRGERDTPEVIRFRKGHHAMEQLVSEPSAVAAADKLAKRLIDEDAVAYKRELADLEEYYRNQPPPAPPSSPYVPPPPMTEEQWTAFWAEQPPLKEARIERVNADTVTMTFTGRIMLTGGCASNMPSFGMEMLTDSGWVERFPFDLIQMDCGMPWGDWEEHLLVLPLRWWVSVYARTGEKELLHGTYRLIFIGGNMKEFRTGSFAIP